MAATEFTRRRFVTWAMVEDAHRAGQSLTLGPRDVITDEAGTRARDLGVTVVREGGGPGRPSSMPVSRPVTGSAPTGGTGIGRRRAARRPLRSRQRSGPPSVAELGTDDPRIDAAIDRVFARRGL